ncbi:MAG TPA: sigma-70 family RNA polymerase sigma factor [Candidatus Eisenbacteria bacterium]|nr:sigma-70 family RNA polymerase sigma factor [Candidatus Eisenbacteria bacterium]
MSDQEADRSCMSRLQAGDTKALEELYDRYSPMLYAVVLRIVGRVADAEEVLQDSWVQAWRRAATWDPARGNAAAWLLTLARSRAIDRIRSVTARQRAETAAPVPDPLTVADEPAASAAQRQSRERMAAALGSLTPSQREVIELAYFGGLSQTEIAARVGAPLGTVKSWTRQGLMRLREVVPQEEMT